MNIKFANLILLIFLATGVSSYAQKSKRELLEARRVQLQKDQVWINALLSNAQKREKNLLIELKDINQKIKVREELMTAIESEQKELNNEIYLNQLDINKNERELKALKKDYGEMIYSSYKSKSQNSRIMFLLSSQSFLQAYKRFQYMKQYTSFRKRQGEEIEYKTNQIIALNDSLSIKKKEKDDLLALKQQEQDEIEKEQQQQKGLLAQVQQKESKYKRQIKQIQRDEARINAQIDKLIRDAIAASNKKAGSNSSTTSSATFALTPEARELAGKFSANKGKLPWPVEKGFVSTYYGRQPHPEFKTLTIESNGVRITTGKGSKAKAVFDGSVLAIQVLPGNKKAVLLQHGDYITVYKDLESTFVSKGDKVKTGQELGVIFTDKVSGKTILPFVLTKNTRTENPKSWIYKM